MKIAYPARVWPEDGAYVVQGLEPMGNLLTYGDTLGEALDNAQEALTGILGAMMDHGRAIPAPAEAVEKEGVYLVEPAPNVAVPLLIRRIREAEGLSQGELAARLGVTYQAVQKWERPGANPSVNSVGKIFRALGKQLELAIR